MKKIISVLLAAALIGTMTACGGKSNSQSEVITVEDYKSEVSEFNDIVYKGFNYLHIVGLGECLYTANVKKNGRDLKTGEAYNASIEALIESTKDEKLTETKLKDDYTNICELYSKLTQKSIDSTEVSTINDAYIEMFDCYCELYTLVTNYYNDDVALSNDMDELDDKIKKNNTMLSTLLNQNP